MKTYSLLRRVASSLTLVVPLLFFMSGAKAPAQTGSAGDRLNTGSFSPHRMDWVGRPPSEGESRLLLEILDGWLASGKQLGLADLDMFLEAFPNSGWAPSLRANLGKFYRE